ncbi:MAG: hypothetical protein JWL65_1939 [Gammaproteobacteria bacterium]|nr:hypothetical protein [Gammaproteobacteria bacterium]
MTRERGARQVYLSRREWPYLTRMAVSAVLAMLSMIARPAGAAGADVDSSTDSATRQSRDDAWWTGPVLAASAATLSQGHFLVEPYVYDSISNGHFDDRGVRHGTARAEGFRSQTYLLYGLTDTVTAGVIPRFGYNEVSQGRSSSGVQVGDVTLQAQYRLTQFQEGHWVPTMSVVLAETVPSGKYDRLGERPSDGLGAGAYTTTVSLYTQHYLWLPNGRILRTRLDLSGSFSHDVRLEDVSVYGTASGFRGNASPGSSFIADSSWEYSVTRNWVLALDVVYEHDANTRVVGSYPTQQSGDNSPAPIFRGNSGSSESLGFAPAVEYNWTSNVGVIFGTKLVTAGHNTDAVVIPVVAINVVY